MPAAISATIYLSVPADAEFIKAFVRGIIIAISAKTRDPFSVNFRRNLTAPGEVRGCPPSFEPCDKALPASEMRSAATPATLVCWGETNSTKNTSEGESQGKSDHRVLLRDADITASTVPAAQLAARSGPCRQISPLPGQQQQLPSLGLFRVQQRTTQGLLSSSRVTEFCRGKVSSAFGPWSFEPHKRNWLADRSLGRRDKLAVTPRHVAGPPGSPSDSAIAGLWHSGAIRTRFWHGPRSRLSREHPGPLGVSNTDEDDT